MKIIGINGSPHLKSQTNRLLELTLEQCKKEGSDIKLIHLSKVNLPFFHGKYKKQIPAKFKKFFQDITEADGIVFASPVHWFNMSSLMKNLIDWMTILEIDSFKLEGKAASFIVVCEEDGGQQAIGSIMSPLAHMGFLFPPYCGLFYNKNVSAKSEHNWMDKEPKLLATNLVKLISKTNKLKWGYEDIL